jgi:hypothetical protein
MLGAAVGAASIAGAATGSSTTTDDLTSRTVPAAQAQEPGAQSNGGAVTPPADRARDPNCPRDGHNGAADAPDPHRASNDGTDGYRGSETNI